MKKDVSILKAMELTGMDAYELLGVDKETKQWIKRSTNTTIGTNALENIVDKSTNNESTTNESTTKNNNKDNVVDITPLEKPSDRFDVEDYIRYQEYMQSMGKKATIKDYFEAVEYYTNGGR